MNAAAPLTLALVGKPNCGKTALFNRLTGARQKVANYAGVTVERKEGRFVSPAGRTWRLVDLPGAYSLTAATPDEAVTRDVLLGRRPDETVPDGIICVVDATNLTLNLRMVLEVARLGLPMVVALNMADTAPRRGVEIDVPKLSSISTPRRRAMSRRSRCVPAGSVRCSKRSNTSTRAPRDRLPARPRRHRHLRKRRARSAGSSMRASTNPRRSTAAPRSSTVSCCIRSPDR